MICFTLNIFLKSSAEQGMSLYVHNLKKKKDILLKFDSKVKFDKFETRKEQNNRYCWVRWKKFREASYFLQLPNEFIQTLPHIFPPRRTF